MSAPSKNLTITMYRELLRGSERHHATRPRRDVAHAVVGEGARVHVALPPRRDLRVSPQQRLSTAPRACLS